MRSRKKQILIAKALFKNSLTVGRIDSQKIRALLKIITSQKPFGLARILKIYKKLLQTALSKEEIILESATEIKNQKLFEKILVQKSRAKRIKFRLNPHLVVGARIIHGDWIFDASLDGKLKQLTNV